jgi:hypothetical protein
MNKEFENRYNYYQHIRSIGEDIRSIVEEQQPIEKIEFIEKAIFESVDSSRWMIYAADLILVYSDNNDAWAEHTTLVEAAENSENYLSTFHNFLAGLVMEADIKRYLDYLERLEREEKKGATNANN